MDHRELLEHWSAIHRLARNLLADGGEVTAKTFRLAPEPLADQVPFRLSLYRIAVGLSLAQSISRRPSSTFPDRIRAVLARLDPVDRAAYLLRDVEDLSAEEAAWVLRTSAAIVRRRTHRARLALTEVFGGAGATA